MRHDDPGGAIGLHLILHQRQAPAGLRGLRQILGQIVADLYPALGDQAGDNGNGIQKKDQVSFIHDKRG